MQAKNLCLGLVSWVVAITGLHAWLNVDWASLLDDYRPLMARKLHVAYIPVT